MAMLVYRRLPILAQPHVKSQPTSPHLPLTCDRFMCTHLYHHVYLEDNLFDSS